MSVTHRGEGARRLVGYVRVGPRERRTTRPDLTLQRALIAERCRDEGWELIGVHEDVRSGRSLRRPGLRAALGACRAGDADGLVVVRLDRLTYLLGDLADLVAGAMEGGYAIVALEEGLDLAAESGRVAGRVLATAARWRPGTLSEPARRLGRRPGRPSSTPPAVAQRIRRLRADGMTLQAICDVLNADRVPTPRGGRTWRPTSLRAILQAGTEAGPGRP